MTSKYFLLSGRRGGVIGGDASVLCPGPSSKLCSALTTRFRALHRRATVRFSHGMVQLSQKKVTGTYRILRRKKAQKENVMKET